MTRHAKLGALGGALVVMLALAAPATAGDDIDRLLRAMQLTALPGERAVGFTLPTVDGGKAKLADYQGKVVLVYFWATWCPYCRRELPAGVEKVHRERRGQPFAVLPVSIEEPKDLVASWVKGAGVTPSVLLDYDGSVARDYGVTATPTTFVIGRDGRLVARAAGTRPWDGPAGRALIDALIAAPIK
ncbi:MAG TPA: TlpA disulfide reductase family protein [Candidatus Dormibacteraeota bacterium]|jgi:peroxiredoxin|nr:TlpA disulfide reductase family protein [Candidatus Dormibacteraeota bacterium]